MPLPSLPLKKDVKVDENADGEMVSDMELYSKFQFLFSKKSIKSVKSKIKSIQMGNVWFSVPIGAGAFAVLHGNPAQHARLFQPHFTKATLQISPHFSGA